MHTMCAIHDTGCQLMALANSCCTATIHAEGSRSAEYGMRNLALDPRRVRNEEFFTEHPCFSLSNVECPKTHLLKITKSQKFFNEE